MVPLIELLFYLFFFPLKVALYLLLLILLLENFFILSIAGPDSTPCVHPAYISRAPKSSSILAVSIIDPAVSTSSSKITACLSFTSPITVDAMALSSFPALLLSINAIGHPKYSEYLYAFF